MRTNFTERKFTQNKNDRGYGNESNLFPFAGNFQNRNLGPYAWDQINTIYFVPDNDLLDPSLSLSLEADVSLELPWEAPGLGCSTPLSDHDDHHHLEAPEHPVLGDFMQPETIS